jgi:D-alanyl-D-alanine dipeptidase
MSHRSGLVREPPVGHYSDTTEPTLAATVASLNQTALVYAPESRIKYSNAAIAVVGRVLEVVGGRPFDEYIQRAVLRPFGIHQGGFTATPDIRQRLAAGETWTLDGRRFPAPVFRFGASPAMNLYASALDLGRSVSVLLQGGRGVIARETLSEMWRPQFADAEAVEGIGLGFFDSHLDGARLVGHDGSAYGYSAEALLLPDEGLGVVALASLDNASAVTGRIAVAALRGMRAARAGRPIPEPEITSPVPPSWVRAWRGRYTHGSRQIELRPRGEALSLLAGRGGSQFALRRFGDSLVLDDPREYGLYLVPLSQGRLRIRQDTFVPKLPPKPKPPPTRWRPLIGEYGWDHSVLYIYESQGRLYGLIESLYPYRLNQIADTVFALPDYGGLYDGERLIFRRGPGGAIREVLAGSVTRPRRTVGPVQGGQLRITPRRPMPELLREARRAIPPEEAGTFRAPDLVDLATLDLSIRFDIRYATTQNFLGTIVYDAARAFLQRPAAEALLRAHRKLAPQGYGLLIHDAYRPWYVTRVFWDATPDSLRWLVADPSRGSRHNRGAAVDLTLYELATGKPVEMVGTYDEATPRSSSDYPGGTSLQRWHRDLLRRAMEEEGFTVLEDEWWHFDFQDWREYPIMNRVFED